MLPRIIAIALLSIAGLPDRASAAEYPWCVYYMDGDVSNCGFASLEQCRKALAGMGGICQPNPFFAGTNSKPATRPQSRT